MSIDAVFSPVSFPSLRSGRQDSVDMKARAQGHAAGYADGLRAAHEEVAAHMAALESVHAEAIEQGESAIAEAVALLTAATGALNARAVPLVTDAQDAMVAAALDLAEVVIGRELGDEESSARAALARALSDVDPALVNVVRLNPLDLALLKELDLASTGVAFSADPTLQRGDAVTEFANGYLDARVHSALTRARAALLGEES